MAIPRKYRNSPAPVAGNSTATPSASSGGSSSGKNPYGTWSIILLSIAGLWLGAKIILFGGEIHNVEIFIIAILSILALGVDKKKWVISLVILVILGIKLLTPTEMEHIVIDKDGVYELPNRSLKVCFIKTGDTTDLLINKVKINGMLFSEHLDGCKDIPKYIKGRVSISLLSGQPYSQEVKDKIGMQDINNNYEYYMRIGFGGYPTIQAR